MNKKLLIGGLVGGVAFFLLGWVIYGMLMKNMMEQMPNCRPDNEMIMWALGVGNLGWGFLIAWLFGKMGGVKGWMEGATFGAIIGLLSGIGFDFIMYATTTMMDMRGVVMDIVAWTVLVAIGSAIIALAMNMGKSAD